MRGLSPGDSEGGTGSFGPLLASCGLALAVLGAQARLAPAAAAATRLPPRALPVASGRGAMGAGGDTQRARMAEPCAGSSAGGGGLAESCEVALLPPLSLRERATYTLQQVLTMGIFGKLGWLVAGGGLATLVCGSAYFVAQGDKHRAPGLAMVRAYSMVLNAPGGSALPADHPNGATAMVANLTFAMGLVMFAVFLGIICDDIGAKVDAVKAGNHRIPVSGHTVLLNWNEATLAVLHQMDLAEADNPGIFPRQVVILADRDKAEMDAAVKAMELRIVRVATRQGNAYSPNALQVVGAERAANVLLLHPAASNDAQVERAALLEDESRKAATLLSLQQLNRASAARVKENSWNKGKTSNSIGGSARVRGPRLVMQSPYVLTGQEDVCRMTGVPFAEVFGMRTIGQVIAHAATEEGVAAVYQDLFTAVADTDELYATPVPEPLVGRTFLQAARALPSSVLIGVTPAAGMGEGEQQQLCPPSDRVLQAGDALLHLSDKRELKPDTRLAAYTKVNYVWSH